MEEGYNSRRALARTYIGEDLEKGVGATEGVDVLELLVAAAKDAHPSAIWGAADDAITSVTI